MQAGVNEKKAAREILKIDSFFYSQLALLLLSIDSETHKNRIKAFDNEAKKLEASTQNQTFPSHLRRS